MGAGFFNIYWCFQISFQACSSHPDEKKYKYLEKCFFLKIEACSLL